MLNFVSKSWCEMAFLLKAEQVITLLFRKQKEAFYRRQKHLDKAKSFSLLMRFVLKNVFFLVFFFLILFFSAFSWPSACGEVVRDLAGVAGEPSIRQNPLWCYPGSGQQQNAGKLFPLPA